MPLGDVLLVWRLRVLLESEGISKASPLIFLFLLPRPPAATTATLLLDFDCSFPLSNPRESAARGKVNVLLLKVSEVAVCSCW